MNLHKRISRTTIALLVFLALCGVVPLSVTAVLNHLAQDVSTASVETRYWPGWGQSVTLIHWHQQPTDPSLVYARLWRVGLREQSDRVSVTSQTFTIDVGDNTVIESIHTHAACYLLEQGRGPDHQPRRLVWLGCVR